MIRVMLVDDHPVVRQGYARLIDMSADMCVVAEAGDAGAALAACTASAPDVVVSDISLPGADGLELIGRLARRTPAPALLAFTMHESPALARRCLEAGGRGYVTKRSAPEVLVEAIAAVARGERYFSRDIAQALAAPRACSDEARLASLSPRELAVLRLLASGHSTRECAQALHLSAKTVANYQTLIRDKLGVGSTAALAHLAIGRGLIEPPAARRA